jgi:hypothetical protein
LGFYLNIKVKINFHLPSFMLKALFESTAALAINKLLANDIAIATVKEETNFGNFENSTDSVVLASSRNLESGTFGLVGSRGPSWA